MSANERKELKRKRPSDNDNDQVQFIAKRPKKELDFNQRRTEEFLENALKCAKQGNKKIMKHHFRVAKGFATNANTLPEYTRRTTEIRKQLGDEKAFHLRSMGKELKRALKSARKGDKRVMNHQLSVANEHATNASTSALINYGMKANNIRHQLRKGGQQESYHLSAMEKVLARALKSAKGGNLKLTESRLGRAKEHATNATSSAMPEFERQAQNIRRELRDEKDFHLRTMEKLLVGALKSAVDGNKKIMESRLERAKVHADSAAYRGIETRTTSIRLIFYGTKPDAATACSRIQNTASRQETPCKEGNNDDDLVIEEELDVNQVIANRVEVAESKGEVITIS